MKKTDLKYLVPNGITFLSLFSGVSAILLAAQGSLGLSAALIFTSYWLDMFDGFSARKLNAQSEFGLQLDSLVDMVSFGVAPAVLVFQHLLLQGISIAWVWPATILIPMAGAFRLARFNMLPPKTSSSKDSIGLTITQAGGTLVLAILAEYGPSHALLPLFTDTVPREHFLPAQAYIPLIILFSALMVSKIPFLPASWFFRAHKLSWGLIIVLAITLVIFPIFNTWFVVYLVYIVVSALRALFNN